MMTVPQKKYFCTRIDEITAQKVNELKDVNSAGNKEIAKMGLANGEIRYPQEIAKVWEAIDLVLSSGPESAWSGSSLGNIEIESMLSGYVEFKKKLADEMQKENNDILTQRNKLYEEATRIKDVAMFGSEEAAHAMLKEFVEWQVK
jgi:tryptophanyl-tRNA synthetase